MGLLTEAARPHWTAAAQGRLAMPACGRCDHVFWPPAGLCPRCLARDIDWRNVSRTGTVTAVATFHRPYHPVPWLAVPYVVVLVALDAGPSFFSNLIGCEPVIGLRVTAQFNVTGTGEGIVQFAALDVET